MPAIAPAFLVVFDERGASGTAGSEWRSRPRPFTGKTRPTMRLAVEQRKLDWCRHNPTLAAVCLLAFQPPMNKAVKVDWMRAYVIAIVAGLLVSFATVCWLFFGGRIDSIWPFILSPGLSAYAVTSDMASKPPVYQTVALLVMLNTAWYLLVALFARGTHLAIRGGAAFLSRQGRGQ